jgi:D-inositol-3-phosphate glycosyltransferase
MFWSVRRFEPAEGAGDLSGIRRRWAKLRWRLRATRGIWLPGRFKTGWIDVPSPDAQVGASALDVRGWALFPSGPPVRVEAWLDDHHLGRARLGLPRPDVRCAIDAPVADVSGFELSVDLEELDRPAGDASLRVIATDAGGRTLELGPVSIQVGRGNDAGAGLAVLPPAALNTPRVPDRPGRRALVFAHQLDLGGAQLYLFELLRELVRQEALNPVVVTSVDGPLRLELEALSVPVHVSSPVPEYDRTAHLGRVEELALWAAAGEFELAIVNTASSYAFPGAEVAARLGIPSMWAIHESFKPRALWSELAPEVLAIAEGALRSASLAVFEAEETRRLFESSLPPGRSLTLPYGVALDLIDAKRLEFDEAEARREAGIDPEAEVVLCLGQVQPRKGQVPLAQAFASIAERHPRARLVVVGGWDDSFSRALVTCVESSGLASRIDIVPLTGDVHTWHGIADILVCASDVESLPRAALEAMAWETPVLTTDVFGLADLITDGVTGWHCPCRDVERLAQTLDRALGTPKAEREAMGRACRASIERDHSFAGYAERFAGLLDQVAPASDLQLGRSNGLPDLSETAA